MAITHAKLSPVSSSVLKKQDLPGLNKSESSLPSYELSPSVLERVNKLGPAIPRSNPLAASSLSSYELSPSVLERVNKLGPAFAHASCLTISSPVLKKQDLQDLFEFKSTLFDEASTITELESSILNSSIFKQQDGKMFSSTGISLASSNKTGTASSTTEISANNKKQVVKTSTPSQHTLSSPDTSNSALMINLVLGATPKLFYPAGTYLVCPTSKDSSSKIDENLQTLTPNKSDLLSLTDKKISTTSSHRIPLTSSVSANTKKRFADEELVSNSSTQSSSFKKARAASNSNILSLASKHDVPSKKARAAKKTTFKPLAPISKRKRNQKSSSNNSDLNNDKVCIEPPSTMLSLVVINHIFIRYHRPITSRTTSAKVKQYQSTKNQPRKIRPLSH
jgi:hypothetical protein